MSVYRKQHIGNRIIKYFIRVLKSVSLVEIFFFPYFIIRWYFSLIRYKKVKFLFVNLTIVLFVALYLIFCYFSLPGVEKVYNYKPVLMSKFYDSNGELIYEFGSERRTHIDIKNVPKMLVYAFVSAEDKTFYTNKGIDLNSIAGTFFKDIVKFIRGQRLGGASTITQQVVKNVLLSNERTISRKIKEIILSYKISQALSKEAIMEIYLNHIYLGMQAYGVVSASEEYFGKTISQLTVPEMALLAAMPKAPSTINPFKNYNRAVARRNWVLLRMMEDGYITQDQYESYSKADLIVRKRHNAYSSFYAPSFFAKSLLIDEKTGFSKENLLRDGYKVQLTIDGELQKIAQNALNHSLEEYTKSHGYTGPIFTFSDKDVESKSPNELLRGVDEPDNLNQFVLAVVLKVSDDEVKIGLRDNSFGSILLNDLKWARQKITETEVSDKEITKCGDVLNVGDVIVVSRKIENSSYYSLEQLPKINGGVLAINPKTGAILAMVGGYADVAGTFNRSIQAFRQMGSIVKPFVYGVAFENGFSPTSIFMDADVSINIGDGVIWNPANDNKRTNGPTTLRVGLERSRNTVTIRLADAVGVKKIRKKIINSGLNKNPENNLSIAIGSVESSLINVATAYSSFANNGIMPTPYLISYVRNITDVRGNNKADNKSLSKDEDIFNRIYFKNCNANSECDIFFEHQDKGDCGENCNYNGNSADVVDENQEKQQENQEKQQVSIEKADDKSEDEVFDGFKKQVRLFTPEVSYQIVNILQGAIKRGTSRRLDGIGLPIASKTGTSNEGKDMWNVIISPEIVIVSYVGYDIPVATNNYGAQFALPINKEILVNLPERYKISDFVTPESIKFVKINRLTGKLTNEKEDDEDVIFEAFKQEDEIESEASDGNEIYTKDSDLDLTDLQ